MSRRAALTLSPHHYREIVDNAAMMVWRSDRDAKVDYVNGTWLRFTGRPIDEELGDGWLDAIHPDDRERCVTLFRANIEKRVPWEREFRLRRHDGVYRYMREMGVPYHDERGEYCGHIGSV